MPDGDAGIRDTLVDVESSVNEHLDRLDWRVHANANQGYSLGGLILNISGKVIANYWLSHVYAPEIEAAPPRHLSSAVGQVVNFLGTMQNEWAGAQAFSSFGTYMAPYVRKDDLSYTETKQCVQELIFNLNVPSRWGTQTPFTNLTFDWTCPEDLRRAVPVLCGEEMPFTYGDLQAKGRVFSFPIPTYNITADFPLGLAQRRPPLRDDREIRPPLLPELPQLRARPPRPADGPRPRQPGDQAHGDPAAHGSRGSSPTPGATSARCATTSRPSA